MTRHPRADRDRRRAGRLHGRAVRRPRQPEPARDRGVRVRRPADDHVRCRELPRIPRRHHGARADGDHARPGRAVRRRDAVRRRHPRRLLGAAVPRVRRRRRVPGQGRDRGDRRDRPPARPRDRGGAAGPRRELLRRLRRRVLQGPGRRRRRRRRLGDGGGDVPRQVRDQRDARPPPRGVPGVADHDRLRAGQGERRVRHQRRRHRGAGRGRPDDGRAPARHGHRRGARARGRRPLRRDRPRPDDGRSSRTCSRWTRRATC